MRQRVNVHYSVDLEELPSEVENLLSKADERLSTCYQTLQTLIKRYDQHILMTTACTEDIGALREELASVDFMLNDATNIINGYVSYRLQDNNEIAQEEEAAPTNPYVEVDQIQEKIQQFKESLTK